MLSQLCHIMNDVLQWRVGVIETDDFPFVYPEIFRELNRMCAVTRKQLSRQIVEFILAHAERGCLFVDAHPKRIREAGRYVPNQTFSVMQFGFAVGYRLLNAFEA